MKYGGNVLNTGYFNCGGIPLVVKDKALICGQRSVTEMIQSIEKFILILNFLSYL